MGLKVDGQVQETSTPCQLKSIEIAEIKQRLIHILHDFPYDTVNLETDTHITDLLDLIKDELDIDHSAVLVSKDNLMEALSCKKCSTEKQEPANHHLNPAQTALSYFDLVAQEQERKKALQYQKFQQINQDLEALAQAMALFQTSAAGDKVDFSSNEEAKAIIDSVKQKWGLPQGSNPYIWDNKNQVVSFLTQKQKELTHRSQEVMVYLQEGANQLKSMVDATKEMLKLDSDLREYINRKTGS